MAALALEKAVLTMSMTTRRDESQGSSARNREIDPEADNHVRKLLTLTVVSGVLYLTTIITNIITGQITHKAFEDAPFGAPPEGLYWVGAVVGLILLVGMYMAVYIPLRKRLREGWYAGAVFATVGLIHAALSAVVAPGNLLLGLPGIALVVVNGIWLFIAFRPGVREGLG
ncbi:hypothetical protein IEE92_01955 [Kocuria sp. cx-116]|uniref:hypothetical protein n=1 Tax=Kocuria sp. cx-116 TaxID=2771378 RepID=UPI0016889F74|nr:hypothetical protein [Kocuria sp. cx-116]MBD2761324.1 hypothetical protein [Kocuria sp. cx-116]